MPDRAIVDDVPTCERCGGPLTSVWDPDDDKETWVCQNPSPWEDCTPRAIVAISDDRQWLVWLDQDGDWAICKRTEMYGFCFVRSERDTGQSADEVLADFLRGQQS